MKSKRVKIGFTWSQDILRFLFYAGAGVGLANLKWYFGFPLMVICFTLAQIVENSHTEIRQLNRNYIVKE